MIPCDVVGGGEYGANALLYKPLSQQTLSYLNDRLNSTLDRMKDIGGLFTQSVRSLYDKYNSREAIQRAKMVLHGAGVHLAQDIIYPVSYDQYHNINLLMQRYVISQPDVNDMYVRNLCYGFEDTFEDPEPGTYGEDRYDYQRVMSGVLQFEENGDGYFKFYSNDDTESELDNLDKISVLDSWDTALRLIAEGKDPTRLDGELL